MNRKASPTSVTKKPGSAESLRASVIIPTYNRADLLARTLAGVLDQKIDSSAYEIIVVDNNSTDNTRAVVESLQSKHGDRIRYAFESTNGLVYGRHTGAREASSEILVFADDDIIASQGWIKAILDSFSNPEVSLVGGKVLPEWETSPPDWIADFWEQDEYGSWNMYLSLIDLGNSEKVIPANLVFGCNFAIRKNALIECGGFHPDSFPGKMIRWRGDGEAGLALALARKGYKTVYNPDACIKHVVPESRLSARYFCKRAFAEGVSNSYTRIRTDGRLTGGKTCGKDVLEKSNDYAIQVMNGSVDIQAKTSREIKALVGDYYKQGFLYHQRQVMNDAELLTWVLKRDYFTSTRPPLTAHAGNTQSEPAAVPAGDPGMNGSTSAEIIYQQALSCSKDGERLLDERRYNQALSCFEKAMYLYTDLKNLHFQRATCLLRIGRTVEAEVALKAELKARPGFQPALNLLASLKTPAMPEPGQPHAAADTAARPVAQRDAGAHSQFMQAARLFESGRLDEAENILRDEINGNGRSSETGRFLARIRQERFATLVEANDTGTAADLSWVDGTPMIQNSAVIYITEKCNSRCITCNAWKPKKEEQLSTDTWIDILSQIRAAGFSSVEFVGGEPLLRPDLPKLTAAAKQLGFATVMVSSNGFLIDRKRLDNLIEHGVNSFHISVDGMRETYQYIRGVDWFDKVVNAIDMISEAKIPLLILTNLVRQNIIELEEIVSMAKAHGAYWFANILENQKFLFKGIDMADIQISEQADIDRTIEKLYAIRAAYPQTCVLSEADIRYIKDFLEEPGREKQVPCPLGFTESYLDASGNVYPGCMSLKPVGNVTRSNLQAILNSSKMRSRLKSMLRRRCPGCTCGYPQRAQLMHMLPG